MKQTCLFLYFLFLLIPQCASLDYGVLMMQISSRINFVISKRSYYFLFDLLLAAPWTGWDNFIPPFEKVS